MKNKNAPMRGPKVLVIKLIIANLSCILYLFAHFNDLTKSVRAATLSISDLTYGKIDVDGDGKYTPGDDMVVAFFIENDGMKILNEAIKFGRINPDGGFDLSPYLKSINSKNIQGNLNR